MRSLYEEAKEAAASLLSQTDTVVIYTYSRTDPEYERNLQYFVEHGMWEGDGCDYIIIVQQVPIQSTCCGTSKCSGTLCQPLLKSATHSTCSAWCDRRKSFGS